MESKQKVSSNCAGASPPENKVLLAWVGLICAFFIGQAIQINNGHHHPVALVFVGIAAAAASVGVLFSKRASVFSRADLLVGAIAAVLCVQFVQLFINPPGIYLKPHPEADWRIYYAGLAVAAVAAGGCLSTCPFWGKWTFWALLASFLSLGSWIILSSPEPKIDVFYCYKEGASALISFKSPYSINIPNIYGHTLFYDSNLVAGNRVNIGFPYFPLTLIAAVPAYIIGDVRYAHLVAACVAGLLMAILAPGPIGKAMAALYWFTPRSFFVIEQSWTEPFMVAGVAICVWASFKSYKLLAVSLGVLFSIKQSLIWMVPLSWLMVPRKWSSVRHIVVVAGLVFMTVTLPWCLIDADGFWNSVVVFQFKQPFRADALTVGSWLALQEIDVFPTAVAFIIALLAVVFVLIASPHTPSAWCIGSCFVYILFFVLNKQAFCNYYYFVLGVSCIAVTAASRNSCISQNSQ